MQSTSERKYDIKRTALLQSEVDLMAEFQEPKRNSR